MKYLYKFLGIILFILSILEITSCKKEKIPTITTSAISNITGTTASCGGNITSEGSGTVIARGICWSTRISPTVGDSKTTDGAGAGTFSSNLTGLNGATAYYVRAYATNNAGTGYGMAMSFTTLGQLPTPTVAAATNVNTISATLNGTVNANYLSTVVTFEYGTSTSYGSSANATQSPVSGNTVSIINANISGLSAGTIYHYRIKAINSLGTTNSDDITFTTLGQVPTVSTLSATNISSATVQLNGIVNANYLSTIVTFEYGTTTNYGGTATASQSPVTGNATTNVSVSLTGLFGGTDYHFRIKAVNALGTTNGNDIPFSTILTDIDGNNYSKIVIGNQVWMKENLKTTKYRNGDIIPNVIDNTSWSALMTGAYCYYNNSTTNKNIYGILYNFYTLVDSRNICPTGWHIPSDIEWTTLTTYLGGENVAGGKLKETGTNHWQTPNTSATNETGFTALPGGYRYADGSAFDVIGTNGLWWSSTENNASSSWRRSMTYDGSGVFKDNGNKNLGFSVRCIRDN